MSDLPCHNAKLWLMPEFDNLELFRAEGIHYRYARHAHPGYSIGVIEAGVGGNYYRGTTYLAPPSSVVLMNPEEAHTGYSAEGFPLTYRMLYPSVDYIRDIAREIQLSGSLHFKDAVIHNTGLAKTIVALHDALERSHEHLKKQSLVVEALAAVLLHYADRSARSVQQYKEHQAIQLIKDYLHDNFRSNISLDQLVTITHLNRAYLIRVFRQTVGMPPYAYLVQIRVRKAKQFLLEGMSVAETAIAVGMSDQSHLTRHFKRIVGITPGCYRKMSRSFKTALPES